jgi:hypothetical protein
MSTGVSGQLIGTTCEGQEVHEAFYFDCVTNDVCLYPSYTACKAHAPYYIVTLPHYCTTTGTTFGKTLLIGNFGRLFSLQLMSKIIIVIRRTEDDSSAKVTTIPVRM